MSTGSRSGQRSLDELGTPLVDVTFCVLDIETTGTDRGADAITEIGAVKVRGGEVLGTFATLVDPGRAIPTQITLITGITDVMVVGAPAITSVLPSLLEFIGDAVIVGHNVGFDLGFLDTARRRSDHPPFPNQVVDTLPLARRLVRDEVRDCKLGTLAQHFRLPHRPSHRALADALATADLLHLLLERSAALGVLGLDHLLELPRLSSHRHAAKLPFTRTLPRAPGVYRFVGADDEVLYVGKATNLRHRVRSYFGSDDRRAIGPLLREMQRVDVTVTADPIVAEVLELRLLHRLRPRYNRVGTSGHRACYVRLSTDERWPRLTTVSTPRRTGMHLGPFPSRAQAAAFIDAVHTALPLRRCGARRGAEHGPCHAAALGRALCPCRSDATEEEHWRVVAQVVAACTTQPHVVLDPLWSRVARLAAEQRYEEAAVTRDRASVFAAAVTRRRDVDALRSGGDVVVRIGETVLHLAHGILRAAAVGDCLPIELEEAAPTTSATGEVLSAEAEAEAWLLVRLLARNAHRLELVVASGELAASWAAVRTPLRLDEIAPVDQLDSTTAPAWSIRSSLV